MSAETKTKILILDDERMVLEFYKTAFEKKGFDVSVYSYPDDALDALRSGYEPAVMLIDITMPGDMSGYEFLETVRKEGLAPKAIKAALTNEGQDAEKQRMAELGSVAHFMKVKYTPAELADTISKIMFEGIQ